MNFHIKAACGYHMGKRRTNNEDNYFFTGNYLPIDHESMDRILVKELQTYRGINLAVFDGMGGHADGQLASFVAAENFARLCSKKGPDGSSREFLTQSLLKMSEDVWERADEECTNMGTTAAVLRLNRVRYVAANVGDSRIYRFRNQKLLQLSTDHSDDVRKDSSGKPLKKASLTQFIGISPEELTIEPSLASGNLHVGDQFLVCSDGLTDMVGDEDIKGILEENLSVEKKTEQLVELALLNGGRDNITVILAEVISQEG